MIRTCDLRRDRSLGQRDEEDSLGERMKKNGERSVEDRSIEPREEISP
jgi:hypothetical protein